MLGLRSYRLAKEAQKEELDRKKEPAYTKSAWLSLPTKVFVL